MFGSGISGLGCLLDAAEAVGIVSKKGSWYYYGEEKLAQGRDKTLTELTEKPDIAECVPYYHSARSNSFYLLHIFKHPLRSIVLSLDNLSRHVSGICAGNDFQKCCDRAIEAKTRAKLTGEVDINEMYEKVNDDTAAEDAIEEEFDLSDEPAVAP